MQGNEPTIIQARPVQPGSGGGSGGAPGGGGMGGGSAGRGAPGINKVDAGRPIEWIKAGWAEFMANPVPWIVMALILGVVIGVANFLIPRIFYSIMGFWGLLLGAAIGGIVMNLLMPVFMGGLMTACDARASGRKVEIPHLFAGFGANLVDLLTIGAVSAALTLVVFLLTSVVGSFFSILNLLNIPILMATWAAPALIAVRGMSAIDAMKTTWAASVANIVPGIVAVILLAVAGIVALIPLGLGLLVLTGVAAGMIYAGCRETFA